MNILSHDLYISLSKLPVFIIIIIAVIGFFPGFVDGTLRRQDEKGSTAETNFILFLTSDCRRKESINIRK